MTKVGVFGAAGRMGSTVCEAVAADPDLELVAAVDPLHAGIDLRRVADVDTHLQVASASEALVDAGAEVVVDFTVADAARAATSPSPPSTACTPWSARPGSPRPTSTAIAARRSPRARCLVAANFAIGAVLMMRFAELAAPWFETAEIIELHHDGKIDAPSGTAMRTAERMAAPRRTGPTTPPRPCASTGARGGEGPGGIPIHSVRLRGPLRPPGGAARHVRPEPHHPPRHLRPHLLHARRPPRRQARRTNAPASPLGLEPLLDL